MKTVFEAGRPFLRLDDVDVIARNRTLKVNEVASILFISIFHDLNKVISNGALYSLREKWPEMYKFCFQRGFVPLLFTTLPKSARKAVNIAQLRAPRVEVTQVDEDENVVMRSDSQPRLATHYTTRLLLSSATE